MKPRPKIRRSHSVAASSALAPSAAPLRNLANAHPCLLELVAPSGSQNPGFLGLRPGVGCSALGRDGIGLLGDTERARETEQRKQHATLQKVSRSIPVPPKPVYQNQRWRCRNTRRADNREPGPSGEVDGHDTRRRAKRCTPRTSGEVERPRAGDLRGGRRARVSWRALRETASARPGTT